MSLGSSIGNFVRGEDAGFLKQISSVLGPDDMLIIGLDGCRNPDRVYHAYNDRHGVTHEFYRNGLRHANKVLGTELFKMEDWNIIGEYDVENGRHQAFVSPRHDIAFGDLRLTKGERIHFEYSHKYSPQQRSQLWAAGGLQLQSSFTDKRGEYCKFLCSCALSSDCVRRLCRRLVRVSVCMSYTYRSLWYLALKHVTLSISYLQSMLLAKLGTLQIGSCLLYFLRFSVSFPPALLASSIISS